MTKKGFFGRVSLGCQRGIECVDGEVCKNGGYCTTKRESNQSYCECKSGFAGRFYYRHLYVLTEAGSGASN